MQSNPDCCWHFRCRDSWHGDPQCDMWLATSISSYKSWTRQGIQTKNIQKHWILLSSKLVFFKAGCKIDILSECWRSLHQFDSTHRTRNLVLLGHTLRRRSSMSESCTSLTRTATQINLKNPDSKTGITMVSLCTSMYFVRGISGCTRRWLKLNCSKLRSSWRELDIDPIKSLRGLSERFACQQPFIPFIQSVCRVGLESQCSIVSAASWTWSVWPNARSSPEEFQGRLAKSWLTSGTGVVNFAFFAMHWIRIKKSEVKLRSKNKKRRKQRRRKDSFFYPIGKLPSVLYHCQLLHGGAAGLVSKHGFFFLRVSVEVCFEVRLVSGLRTSASRLPIWALKHSTESTLQLFSFPFSIRCTPFIIFYLILLSTKFTSLYFTSFTTSLLLVFSKPGDVARPGADAAAAAGTALPAALAGEAAPLVMRSGSRMRLRKTQLHSEKPNRDE